MAGAARWLDGRRWWAAAMVVAAGAGPIAAQPPARGDAPVAVAGDGRTTYVLLSGLVGGTSGFERLRARLVAHGHRVVTVDPYRLSLDSADVTFAALARRVEAVLAERGVTGAHVVGHAHGAGVALRLAASAPARVATLTFLDVGALPENRTRVFSSSLRLAPIIARLPGGRGYVRRRFLDGLRENSADHAWLDEATQRAYTEPFLDRIGDVVDMARRLARAHEPEPLADVVARVRAPVAVLLGAEPHPASPDSAELTALAPLGERLRVERLPGVGHFPHEEAPDRVAARLLELAPAAPGEDAPPARPPYRLAARPARRRSARRAGRG